MKVNISSPNHTNIRIQPANAIVSGIFVCRIFFAAGRAIEAASGLAPAAVPSPLQASVLICPGFSFFCTFFLPPYRCIGIFLNLSLSALIPDGREEQSVCSVLVAPCIRSSSCSFLIAVVVASSINANLSLSIFFLPFCSFGFLLHIQYAGILRRGYFFCGFFCVVNLSEKHGIWIGIWTIYKKAKLHLLPSGFCSMKTKSQG